MKRTMLLAGLVALLLCTSVLAVPSVTLDGKMYIYMTGYNTVGGLNHARVAALPWTAGTAGALNASFFDTVNHNGDYVPFGYSNFDLYNHNLHLDVLANTASPRYPTVWKVDGTTGAGTSVFVATNGDPGYYRSMAVDRTTGDIYFSSSGDARAVRLSDVNNDGDYNDAGEQSGTLGPSSLWGGGRRYEDAEFFGGSMYFATGATRTPGYFVSRLNGGSGGGGSKALGMTSWPGWPYGVGDPWTESHSYLAVGDPDKDGKKDIYSVIADTAVSQVSSQLGHWEDRDDNGSFEASEFIGSISLGGYGSGVRDVELVTDGTHWMIAYMKSTAVRYINLTDNGSFTGETGLLFTTGLAPSNSDFIHLKMDQTLPAIPEPGTLLLIGTGALGALGWMRRRKMR